MKINLGYTFLSLLMFSGYLLDGAQYQAHEQSQQKPATPAATSTPLETAVEALQKKTCSICQEDAGNQFALHCACNPHCENPTTYHIKCLGTWFLNSPSCPVCRKNVTGLRGVTVTGNDVTSTAPLTGAEKRALKALYPYLAQRYSFSNTQVLQQALNGLDSLEADAEEVAIPVSPAQPQAWQHERENLERLQREFEQEYERSQERSADSARRVREFQEAYNQEQRRRQERESERAREAREQAYSYSNYNSDQAANPPQAPKASHTTRLILSETAAAFLCGFLATGVYEQGLFNKSKHELRNATGSALGLTFVGSQWGLSKLNEQRFEKLPLVLGCWAIGLLAGGYTAHKMPHPTPQ